MKVSLRLYDSMMWLTDPVSEPSLEIPRRFITVFRRAQKASYSMPDEYIAPPLSAVSIVEHLECESKVAVHELFKFIP